MCDLEPFPRFGHKYFLKYDTEYRQQILCSLGWLKLVHKRMFYIRMNLRMLQHSNAKCNIRMQQNDVFW